MQHIFRRSGAWRNTIVTAVAGFAMLALLAASAHAKVVRVTGDQATITPSLQATQFLSEHGVSTSAIAPAVLDGSGNLTLPIVGGRVHPGNHRGAFVMSGGVEFSKGSRSVDLTRLAAVNARGKALLSARVGHRRMVVARLVNRTVDVSGTSATVNADLELSSKAARAINHVAAHHVVSAGAPLGHATATITTG